jgi:hypothetical protein
MFSFTNWKTLIATMSVGSSSFLFSPLSIYSPVLLFNRD